MTMQFKGSTVTETAVDQRASSVSQHLGRLGTGDVAASGRETIAMSHLTQSSLFFQAMHRAYEGHHAFGIRPEALMFLVNATIAETVKANPKHYHSIFTSSTGREIVRVIHDGLRVGSPKGWDEAIGMFDGALKNMVPPGIMGHMLPDLTTATLESNLSSLVTFMDAASPFYDYRVMTRCGIPRVVLFGTAADYRKILTSCAALSEVFSDHLGPYFKGVLPVLSTIADEAERAENGLRTDATFWSEMYKHHEGSGTSSYAGWASVFVGYVNQFDRYHSGAVLTLRDDLGVWTPWYGVWRGKVKSGSEQSHVSSVPFLWEYMGTDIPMTFCGGILGVDIEEGALTPSLSWAVTKRE